MILTSPEQADRQVPSGCMSKKYGGLGLAQCLLEEAEQEGVEPVPTLPQLGQLGHSTLQTVQALSTGAYRRARGT